MTARFEELTRLYDDGYLAEILKSDDGLYFLKLLSMSGKNLLGRLCRDNSISVPDGREPFEFVFEHS